MDRIETLHVFLCRDENGDEGVPAVIMPGTNVFLPLVAADQDRLRDILPRARELAKVTGTPIKHVRFNAREDLEIIEP